MTVDLAADLAQTVDPWGCAGATALMEASGGIDVRIPLGGAGLIRSVVDYAKVPVIETGTGNCHVDVDAGADLAQAEHIVTNSKTQHVGVCNAAETLLVHQDVAGGSWSRPARGSRRPGPASTGTRQRWGSPARCRASTSSWSSTPPRRTGAASTSPWT